jgi:uncharacterized membrane protein
MKNLGMIGKILFCVPFLAFGIFHLMNANQMAGMIPTYLPGGAIWVYVSGVALLLAAISILTGRNTKLATMLLGVMLILFVLMLHAPNLGNADAMMAQMAMSGMLKDLGLAGAAFMLSANSNS